MNSMATSTQFSDPLLNLLSNFSVEIVSIDKASIEAAGRLFKAGTEVFIASLPKHKAMKQIEAAIDLKGSGLVPVPHIVARNIADRAELESLLRGLVQHAGVDSVLVLGGDRDKPLGIYNDSLQLLETGLFEKYGVKKLYLSCYPEGHQRISNERLELARTEKLALAMSQGMDITLVSQFCFDPKPIIAWAKALRAAGVTVPYRVGVAGPASKAALVKFALLCGVGPSLRALQERDGMARNILAGETPEALLREVAVAQEQSPMLKIEGAHFFTFGSLAKTAEWLDSLVDHGVLV